MPILIGTSGWQYRDWRGALYPDRCPTRCWLQVYAEHFATVENNNAFYRLPERETFTRWREHTPAGFVMAVKASRYLTHIKRLRDPAEPVARLMDRVVALGDRLGPVLLQLPPTLRVDVDLLGSCLAQFPRTVRVAVEPRHPSWWTGEVRDLLTRRAAALVWADRNSRPVTPLWRTTDWGYLRLHAGRAHPRPRYGQVALSSWTDRISRAFDDSQDVFVYFNNDSGAAAVADARALTLIADRRRRTAPVPRGSTAHT
jgi:uncharacterized protein YecE (DUF72 family)